MEEVRQVIEGITGGAPEVAIAIVISMLIVAYTIVVALGLVARVRKFDARVRAIRLAVENGALDRAAQDAGDGPLADRVRHLAASLARTGPDGPYRTTTRPEAVLGDEALDEAVGNRANVLAIPGRIVSFGLLVTFVGLMLSIVQAYRIVDPSTTGIEGVASSMGRVLEYAGIKFLTSATALASAIVLDRLLRAMLASGADGLRRLRRTIHARHPFLSSTEAILALRTAHEVSAARIAARIDAGSSAFVTAVHAEGERLDAALAAAVAKAAEALAASTDQGTRQIADGVRKELAAHLGGLAERFYAASERLVTLSDSLRRTTEALATTLAADRTERAAASERAIAALQATLAHSLPSLETTLAAVSANGQRLAEFAARVDGFARTAAEDMERALGAARTGANGAAEAAERARRDLAEATATLARQIEALRGDLGAVVDLRASTVEVANDIVADHRAFAEAAAQLHQHMLAVLAAAQTVLDR